MSRLLTLLDVARGADDDTWIGPASGPEGKRSFGGQFVAQSLAAACRTVEDDRQPTNMHLQFLRGGQAGDPVAYTVTPVFDGRTASARRVEARQDGRLLTTSSVSFAVDLPGPEHGSHVPCGRSGHTHRDRARRARTVDAARRTGHQDRRPEAAAASSCGGSGGGQRFRYPTSR